METPNECIQDRNSHHESGATEVMNDESIEVKVREILEEWNEQGETSNLNKFKRAVKNASSIKLAKPPDK